MLTKIKCKSPDCCAADKNKRGCSTCGGFGYVLEQRTCIRCADVYWFKILTGTTMYEGKIIYSFDGMPFICHKDGAVCENCENSRGKE